MTNRSIFHSKAQQFPRLKDATFAERLTNLSVYKNLSANFITWKNGGFKQRILLEGSGLNVGA